MYEEAYDMAFLTIRFFQLLVIEIDILYANQLTDWSPLCSEYEL